MGSIRDKSFIKDYIKGIIHILNYEIEKLCGISNNFIDSNIINYMKQSFKIIIKY